MASFDSLHDDLHELVFAHLGDGDLLEFAATSKTNERLVCAFMERWCTGEELEIFIWKLATKASGKLPPIPGYISDDSWSMLYECYSDGSDEFLTFSRSTACAFAAASGNLDMLKCLRRNGYPWDDVVSVSGIGYLVTARAAANGHFETLRWARTEGCACNWPSIKWLAAAGGHVDMLSYAGQREPLTLYDAAIPAIAARHGQLLVLDWMWWQDIFITNKVFRERAIGFACEAACADNIGQKLPDVINQERADGFNVLRGSGNAFNWLRKVGCGKELMNGWDRQTLTLEYNEIRARSYFYHENNPYFQRWPLYLSAHSPKPWNLI